MAGIAVQRNPFGITDRESMEKACCHVERLNGREENGAKNFCDSIGKNTVNY